MDITDGEGFQMTVRTAEVAFRYFHRYHVNGRAERIVVMRRLVAKKKAKYIRSSNEFLHGKKILAIKIKNKTIDKPENLC